MKYGVEIARSAERELFKLPPSVRKRIISKLTMLEQDPRPNGSKKLRGSSELWRIRVGVYRVIYLIDDAVRLVRVERTAYRSEVYR